MYGGRDFQPNDLTTSPSTSPASSPHSSHRHHNTATGHSNTYYTAQDQFSTGKTTYRPNTGSNGRTKSTDSTSGVPRGAYSSSSSPRASRDRSGSGGSGKRRKVIGGGGGGGKRAPSDWRVAGGPGRDHSVLIELELDKVCMYVCTCTSDALCLVNIWLIVHVASPPDLTQLFSVCTFLQCIIALIHHQWHLCAWNFRTHRYMYIVSVH